jgi:hypothetical protein
MTTINLADNLPVTKTLATLATTIQLAVDRNAVDDDILICLAGAMQTLWDLTGSAAPAYPTPQPNAAWEAAPDPAARWYNIDAAVRTTCCGEPLYVDSGFREACGTCGQVYRVVQIAHIERLRDYPPPKQP